MSSQDNVNFRHFLQQQLVVGDSHMRECYYQLATVVFKFHYESLGTFDKIFIFNDSCLNIANLIQPFFFSEADESDFNVSPI